MTEQEIRDNLGDENNYLDEIDFDESEDVNDNSHLKYANECFAENNPEQKRGEEKMNKENNEEIENLKSQMKEMMQMMQSQMEAQNQQHKEEVKHEQKDVEEPDDAFPFEDEEEDDDIFNLAKERENDNIFDMAILDAFYKRDKNNKRYLVIEIAPVNDPDKVRKLTIHDKDRMIAIAKNISPKISGLPGKRVKVKVKRNKDSYNDYYFSFESEFKSYK